MTLPTYMPPCPNCSASMRLERVLPTPLPTDCTNSYVFGCTICGTAITRTIRSSPDEPLVAPALMSSPLALSPMPHGPRGHRAEEAERALQVRLVVAQDQKPE